MSEYNSERLPADQSNEPRKESDKELSHEAELLRRHTEQIKQRYEEQFRETAFMTEKVWLLLALIDLYDSNLTQHLVGTYRIAAQVIRESVSFDVQGGQVDVRLADFIEQEGFSIEGVFLPGALLHDIGKIVLPRIILNNRVTYDEALNILWDEGHGEIAATNYLHHFFPHFDFPRGEEFTPQSIAAVLRDAGISPTMILPVKILLDFDQHREQSAITEQQIDEALEQLRVLFGTDDMYFREFIESHEEASRQVLQLFGLDEMAQYIGGDHHGYVLRNLQEAGRHPQRSLETIIREQHQEPKQILSAPKKSQQTVSPNENSEANTLVRYSNLSQWKLWIEEILSEKNPSVISKKIESHESSATRENQGDGVASGVFFLARETEREEYALRRQRELNETPVRIVAIQIADVTDALLQARSYKLNWDELDTLNVLVSMAESEARVNERVTSVFLKALLQGDDRYRTALVKAIDASDPRLNRVQEFLREQREAIQKNLEQGRPFYFQEVS